MKIIIIGITIILYSCTCKKSNNNLSTYSKDSIKDSTKKIYFRSLYEIENTEDDESGADAYYYQNFMK